jgi:ferredoxin-NADP reductase
MKVPEGEVSPYVVEKLQEGDKVELRGPFGRFFVWDPQNTQPILLVGGGSGIIPMHSIYRAHQESKSSAPMQVLYSSHTYEDILFKEDFLSQTDVTITLTRDVPPDWQGKKGRVDLEELKLVLSSLPSQPLCYICGMSPFVNAISEGLESLGVPSTSIRTERFG